jgi:succinate-semialdehyde dehydrogenase/glutarate-semialdehyde dehydrogenase
VAIVETVGSDSGSRRRLRHRDPATLEPLGEIEVCDARDVAAAVGRARKAQAEWAELGFDERGRFLRRAADRLVARQEDLLAVLRSETGRPDAESVSMELLCAADALHYYARRARKILAERRVPLHLMKTRKLRIAYRPLGVVGIITPWNFPFLLSLNPVAQALMAGNAVLLKPSEVTPRSGALVGELFRDAQLPEGVLQVLQGDGETGAALVDARPDKISFTGSVETGRRVAEACGRNLIRCTVELGGKDPMIVCADADLERAAAGAVWGAFANAGQVCCSTERVYVVDEVHDAFVEKVVEKAGALRQGPDGESDVGAVIHAPQLEILERHVRNAVENGARVLAGGRRNPAFRGLYFEPTVLVDVDHGMAVMREETFGPILPIMRVRDEAEALQLAGDTRYGLSASVWTRDRRRGADLARRIESGSAVVNDCMVTYGVTEAPFGGLKDSGFGQVNGEIGLRSYCHAQSILIDRLGRKTEPTWFPYTARKERALKRALRWVFGTSIGRWLA